MIKPRKPIRRRSARMVKLMKEYNKQKALFLNEHPMCAVFPYVPATEIHHKKGRLGSLLLDERFWLPVSLVGHTYIHNNPALSYEQGWMIKRNL
jgi:hypothetical protein